MRKECIISILIIGVLLISGCTKVDPGYEHLKSGDAHKQQMFLRNGECDEHCMAAINAYQDAVRLTEDPQIKAEALQKQVELLLLVKRYEEAGVTARTLVESAHNSYYHCSGLILLGQASRMQQKYEEAFDHFTMAQQECTDRQDFIRENICYLYDKSGKRDKAVELCPEKYS